MLLFKNVGTRVGLAAAAPCICLESLGLSQANARTQLKKVGVWGLGLGFGVGRNESTSIVMCDTCVSYHASRVARHASLTVHGLLVC